MAALSVREFVSAAREVSLLDVRTPAEYAQGHIPGAVNLPLFSNEERAVIGTIYVQQGQKLAIKKGLEFIGPRMRDLVEQAEPFARAGELLVHCWRGGMRSGAVSWLLGFYGFRVNTLAGGYKSFRSYVLNDVIPEDRTFVVLGGRTGSGKTRVLREIQKAGQAVVDLEGLAHHKGSAFGSLGETESVTQEQFENDLADCLLRAANVGSGDTLPPVWLEDESRTIGRRSVPAPIMEHKDRAPLIYLDVSMPDRVQMLVEEYGRFSTDEISQSIRAIEKRLGGLAARTALEAAARNDLAIACEIVLGYYDRAYDYQLSRRTGPVIRIAAGTDARENALRALDAYEQCAQKR